MNEKVNIPIEEWNLYIAYINRMVVRLLVEENGYNEHEAFLVWLNSSTYGKFHDLQTGLYNESPAYIWNLLKEELAEKQ